MLYPIYKYSITNSLFIDIAAKLEEIEENRCYQ